MIIQGKEIKGLFLAPMAGITDANFLNKVIPLGFDVATLGGYSLDAPTIEASKRNI